MRNKIKAVFFDIDGTLVSFTTHTVPDSAREAIKRLRERGIKVFIATGRLLRHTDVVRDIEVDGYITVNGSYCLTSSGEVIYEQAFPQQTVERIFSFMEQYGFAMELMTQENIFVEEITPEVQRAIDMVDIVPAIAPLREIAAKQKVFQVCPYISHELEQEILPQLPECVGSRWTELFMDVNMRGIDKSIAARKVMEYYGFTMDESMAFGDGGNDVSLVKDVALGVAMGNACDSLKEVADYITTGVDEDGIARALEYFELI